MTIWIGRIEPSMWFEGAWWQEILPEDVRLAVLSLGVQRLAQEDLERAHDMILDKVDLLESEGVDVINVGGSPVVTAHGREGHERLISEIAARVTRPFVTALTAEMEAIRAVGANSVVIASPYPAAQTEKRVGVLTEEGFEVVGHHSLDIARNREIAMLEPSRVLAQAVTLADEHPEADALYFPCGSLPVTGIIGRIETETGRPAVTCVQAQVHACLTRASYQQPIHGYGRLLDQLGAINA